MTDATTNDTTLEQYPAVEVTISVRFDPDSSIDVKTLASDISRSLDNVIGEGLLTASNNHLTIDEWTVAATGLEAYAADITEQEMTSFLADQLESGNMKLEDVPALMARYAMSTPAEMRIEFAERMGLGEVDGNDEKGGSDAATPCTPQG